MSELVATFSGTLYGIENPNRGKPVKFSLSAAITLFFFLAPLYGACSFIPSSLQEAELALENGEIDSLCFIHYRTLLLQPVEPLREGWSRIRDLAYELDARTFPSLADMHAAENKDELIEQFPWLRELEPFFTLSRSASQRGVTGLVSADISAGYFSGDSRTRSRSLLRGMRTGSGGEVSLVRDSGAVEPYKRVVSLYSREGRFHLSAGNFDQVKSALLWGAFRSSRELIDCEQWLFGTRSGWNGFHGTADMKAVHFDGVVHIREKEELYSSLLTVPLKALFMSGGVVVQNREEWLFRAQLRHRSESCMAEFVRSSQEGFAALGRVDLSGKYLQGEGEVWYLSDRYSPEMSLLVRSLASRYGRESGSAVGVVTRFRWKFPHLILDSRFQGEVMKDCGRGEYSLTAMSRTRSMISLKQRIMQLQKYEYEDLQIEQVLRVVPGMSDRSVSFPCTGGNLLRNGRWNRASFTGGIKAGSVNSAALSGWFRWYRAGEQRSGLSFTLAQKIGKHGASSLALTVPFAESDGMEMYGKASFLF